jgi:inorganic triphosphatase YgiF
MPEGREIELKFEVDPAAAARLEQILLLRPGAKGPLPSQSLISTYHDTADGALRKAGFALRVRQVGDKRVQTVKGEAEGLSTRGEWECAIAGDAPDLKAAADTPLGPALRDLKAPLEPVFTTRVERTRHLVRQGRSRIEAAIDQGHVEAGGRAIPICELELELVSGPPAGLYALARRLSDAAPLRLSFVTKAERGWRLALGETAPEAVRLAKARLRPGMSVRQAFQATAAAALRQWTGNAAALAVARRPEAVHQMRVALRRLRTAMTLFKAAAADDGYARLNGELKWLAGELDLARDIDVLIEDTFRPAAHRLHDQAGMAGLGERLLKARTKAYDRVIDVLGQPRHLHLVLDMAAWIDCGRWADAADPVHGPLADRPVEALAREGLDRLRRQIKRRGKRLKGLDAERRHRLRIRAKRLRYALEFFDGLHERRKDRRQAMLSALRGLQDSLGALNDMTVARHRGLALAEGGGRVAGESEAEGQQQAYAVGLAIGLRLTATQALLTQAEGAYDAFLAIKAFWRD